MEVNGPLVHVTSAFHYGRGDPLASHKNNEVVVASVRKEEEEDRTKPEASQCSYETFISCACVCSLLVATNDALPTLS